MKRRSRSKYYLPSQDAVRRVIAMTRQCMTVKEIADETGYNAECVRSELRRAGVNCYRAISKEAHVEPMFPSRDTSVIRLSGFENRPETLAKYIEALGADRCEVT